MAALLTFFAVGVAIRPADPGHPYGHGKAEHLAALAEAAVLVIVSVGVAVFAVLRLTGHIETEVNAAWWAFAVVLAVIAIDLSRTVISLRSARRYSSAALLSNALHFGSDLAGTLAVLGGLTAAALGWPQGDSVAALFVAVLVVTAAGRLIRRNIDVFMDRAPRTRPRRRVVRFACTCRGFGFTVCGFARRPDGTSSTSSSASLRARPSRKDTPRQTTSRKRFDGRCPRRMSSSMSSRRQTGKPRSATARRRRRSTCRGVREIHNVNVLTIDGRTEISLHLKLPGDLTLDEAHGVAENVEQSILDAVPEAATVRTHLEPLAEAAEGWRPSGWQVDEHAEAVLRIVNEETGGPAARPTHARDR